MTHMMTAAKSGDAHLAALEQMTMMVRRQALTLNYNDVLLLMAGALLPGRAANLAVGEAGRRSGGGALRAWRHDGFRLRSTHPTFFNVFDDAVVRWRSWRRMGRAQAKPIVLPQ